MPLERLPQNPLPPHYAPLGGRPYRVTDGDSWLSLAARLRTEPANLIRFNFMTLDPSEVNWYLRRNVGCQTQTADGQHWVFSRAASPGVIYLPPDDGRTVRWSGGQDNASAAPGSLGP